VDNYFKVKVNGWFLIDTTNGNPELLRPYVWQFDTRAEALRHKKEQHKKPSNARLLGPVKLDAVSKYCHRRRELNNE
jgi:hypothetical protein